MRRKNKNNMTIQPAGFKISSYVLKWKTKETNKRVLLLEIRKVLEKIFFFNYNFSSLFFFILPFYLFKSQNIYENQTIIIIICLI